jgi:hypothetical protein
VPIRRAAPSSPFPVHQFNQRAPRLPKIFRRVRSHRRCVSPIATKPVSRCPSLSSYSLPLLPVHLLNSSAYLIMPQNNDADATQRSLPRGATPVTRPPRCWTRLRTSTTYSSSPRSFEHCSHLHHPQEPPEPRHRPLPSRSSPPASRNPSPRGKIFLLFSVDRQIQIQWICFVSYTETVPSNPGRSDPL